MHQKPKYNKWSQRQTGIIQKEKRRLNLKTETEKVKKIVKVKAEDRIAQEKECI